MDKPLYDFIVNKHHHIYRHTVDWNLGQEYAAKGLSPIERMANRFERLCKEERPLILEGEQIVFLRTVANLPDIFTQNEWNEIKAKHHIHELGYLSNLSPNYYDIIAKGLLAKRETADEYGKLAIDNLIALSDKYLDEAKKQGREDLVEVLTQVPRYPARNFREALQFFRILHFGLWLEGNYHNTVGRFDRYMYPYLKQTWKKESIPKKRRLTCSKIFSSPSIKTVICTSAFNRAITGKA